MALERPAWLRRAWGDSGDGTAPAAKKQLLAEKPYTRGGGSNTDKMMKAMAELTLVNAAEIRSLAATTWMTWLVPLGRCAPLEAALDAGKRYNEEAKRNQEARKAGAEDDGAGMGPPHLAVWEATARAAAELPGPGGAAWKAYYAKLAATGSAAEVGAEVKYFRV